MGKKPDYRVGALNKETEKRGTIGAAWENKENGLISVVLNPFVTIPAGGHMVITLFPADYVPKKAEDEEIPF